MSKDGIGNRNSLKENKRGSSLLVQVGTGRKGRQLAKVGTHLQCFGMIRHDLKDYDSV